MSNTAMYELSGPELDAVAAGAPPLGVLATQFGLVNVGVPVTIGNLELELLNNNQVQITDNVTDNVIQVGAGAAVAILSGAAVGLVRQLGTA
jgi:hypothetical protein